MFDYKLQRVCTHELFDIEVTIQGSSPSFLSVLPYAADGSTNFMTVREFSATEGLSSFIYARDGFTNWTLGADNLTVTWNGLNAANLGSSMGGPGTGIASFLDASTMISPQPKMLISYRTSLDNCPICY